MYLQQYGSHHCFPQLQNDDEISVIPGVRLVITHCWQSRLGRFSLSYHISSWYLIFQQIIASAVFVRGLKMGTFSTLRSGMSPIILIVGVPCLFRFDMIEVTPGKLSMSPYFSMIWVTYPHLSKTLAEHCISVNYQFDGTYKLIWWWNQHICVQPNMCYQIKESWIFVWEAWVSNYIITFKVAVTDHCSSTNFMLTHFV